MNCEKMQEAVIRKLYKRVMVFLFNIPKRKRPHVRKELKYQILRIWYYNVEEYYLLKRKEYYKLSQRIKLEKKRFQKEKRLKDGIKLEKKSFQ